MNKFWMCLFGVFVTSFVVQSQKTCTNPCVPNPCGVGVCTISPTDADKAVCTCPYPTAGKTCQYDLVCDTPYVSKTCARFGDTVVFLGDTSKPMTWNEAKKACEDLGQEMVMPKTKEYLAFVQKLIQDVYVGKRQSSNRIAYWVGIRFQNGKGLFNDGTVIQKSEIDFSTTPSDNYSGCLDIPVPESYATKLTHDNCEHKNTSGWVYILMCQKKYPFFGNC